MDKNILLLMMLILGGTQCMAADQGNTAAKQFQCLSTKTKVVVDGVLDEDVWKSAPFTEFTQQEPVQGEAPTCKSAVWFAYDAGNLYFAGKFYDPHPDSILARLVRRDFVFGDPSDGAVLYIDPYHDRRNGFYFYVSAAGTQADGTIENDQKSTDETWDAVWEGVSKINDDSWTVEMRIPLSQLRFKDADPQTWGFNVERYFSRNGETDMIAYTPRNENGFASRFPSLTDIRGIKASSGIELLPYVTGRAEYIGNDANDPFNGNKYIPGAGLDIKSALGSGLSFTGTINPDFGQVEVDPAVVNLTDVESSFDEKRPFFMEGVNIFRFGGGGTNSTTNYNWQSPNIFYSRRIGRAPQRPFSADYSYMSAGTHILGAGKVSGQVFGDWKIATLHALTNREKADISINGEHSKLEAEPMTYYGVFRLRRDYNQSEQGLGFLATYTNRFFDDPALKDMMNKSAVVAAADGWTFLDKDRTYVLTGWAAASNVTGNTTRMVNLQRSSLHYFQRPDASYLGVDSQATSLTGYAGRFMLNKNRGQWILNSAVGFLSPKFEINDLGYGQFSDLINMHVQTGYRWNTPASFYQNIGFTTAFFTSYDYGFDKTMQGYALNGYTNLPDLSGAGFTTIYYDKSYNARRTRGGPLTQNPVSRYLTAYYYTNNRVWWVLNPSFTVRHGEDYTMYDYNISLELKVTPTLTLTVVPDFTKETYNAQYIKSYADAAATETYNRRYVFAHLDQKTLSTEIRLDWILSPKLSIQAYVQPLLSSGKYTDYKFLNKSKSYDFVTYGQNGSTIQKNVDTDGSIIYDLDPDGSGPAVSKPIGNQDLRYLSLRGNAVLRWEYMPGSTIFFIWTQSRQDIEPVGEFEFDHSMRDLSNAHPDNIFMIKLTYWLGI